MCCENGYFTLSNTCFVGRVLDQLQNLPTVDVELTGAWGRWQSCAMPVRQRRWVHLFHFICQTAKLPRSPKIGVDNDSEERYQGVANQLENPSLLRLWGFSFALLSAPFPVVIDALSGGCSAGLAFLAMVR
jgi:hypothetical protein